MRSARPRRGISLIETATAMAAGMAITGAAVTAIVAATRADRRFDARDAARRALTPLVERLRDDLHSAQRLTWDETTGALTLSADGDRTITYRSVPGQWRREADGVLTAYRRPPRAVFRCDPAAAAAHDVATVRLSVGAGSVGRHRASLEITLAAEVGRDRRYFAP